MRRIEFAAYLEWGVRNAEIFLNVLFYTHSLSFASARFSKPPNNHRNLLIKPSESNKNIRATARNKKKPEISLQNTCQRHKASGVKRSDPYASSRFLHSLSFRYS
jgi:hypothetical protein